MPAIKVRCAPGRMGEYRGVIYTEKSQPFYLVDRKDELGTIRLDLYGKPITAEQAFSDYEKNRRYGWMVRLEATPKELSDAQRRADLEDQPGLAFQFHAGNSGEAAGAAVLGDIEANTGNVNGGMMDQVPKQEHTHISLPGGGPSSPNLEVI